MKKLRIFLLIPGAAVFVLLVVKLDVHTILSNLAQLKWYFLTILLITSGWHILKTWAWMFALEPGCHNVRYPEFFKARLIGEAINYAAILSQVGGDPLKAYALRDKLPLSRGIASVLLDRIVYTATSIMFIALGIMVLLSEFTLGRQVHTLMLLTLGCLFIFWASLSAVLHFRVPIASKTLKFLAKLPFLKRRLRDKVSSGEKVDGHMFTLFHDHRWRMLASMALHMGGLLLGVVEIYAILAFIGHPVTFTRAFLLGSLTLIFNSASFFVPASLGTFEGAHYLMFHLLRMSPDAGLTLAIVKRIRALVWVGIGLALLPLARSGKKLTPEFSAEFESAEFQSPGFQGEVLKQ